MILIPYRLETSYSRVPISNAALIGLTTVSYIFTEFGVYSKELVKGMVLRDWNLWQMIGNMFLHADIFHIVGNMIFLWVFGNAICSSVGNIWYCLIYLFLGIFASASHLLFSGAPAIGASGAINGIVGMTLVLYPVNELNCFYAFYFFFMGKAGTFKTKSFWMIALWFVFDIFGLLFGGGRTAYWAHLGGFVAGILTGIALLAFKVVETFEPTLLEIISGKEFDPEPQEYDWQELHEMSAKKLDRKTKEELIMLTSTPETSWDTKEVKKNAWESSIDSMHRAWSGGGESQHPEPAAPSPALPALPVLQAEPVPVFRVLRVLRSDDALTCYFVNDGDTISNVHIESDLVQAEIQPEKLIPKKSSGWIRLTAPGDQPLSGVKLKLSFDGGPAGRAQTEMSFSEQEKKFSFM
jgi:membrane associated rhomboid family serine protease